MYTARLLQRAQRRSQLEHRPHHALTIGELSLRSQSIVDTASMDIVGAEVLPRWHSIELSEVSLAELIPMAEDAGLIDDIGE